MGCCEDCDQPSETLQDEVIFSELSECFVSALGKSWSGSVRRSVIEIRGRNFFSDNTVTNSLVKCLMADITYRCCPCTTLTAFYCILGVFSFFGGLGVACCL